MAKTKAKKTPRPRAKTVSSSRRPAAGMKREQPEPARHDPASELDGWITHTDLASNDPLATKAWVSRMFGWKFRAPFPTPNGDVHLFAYSDRGGGAVRNINPPEIPGSIPYVHVSNCQASYDKALKEGAGEMMSPTTVMEGVTIAIVRAPGGVPIGFSGP